MAELNPKSGVDAMEVAAWLRQHPGFLKDFPDLAMQLQVPREQGPAASLAGYQLEVLRDKNAELQRHLAELAQHGHDNEQLVVQVHSMMLALMRARSLDETVRTVVASLSEDFHTDLVRLVLFRQHPELPRAEWLYLSDGASDWPGFAEFLARRDPLCGRLADDKLEALFADRSSEVASAALIHLGKIGMLAMGSHAMNRFHPGIGTLFLKLIGEGITTALQRFEGDA